MKFVLNFEQTNQTSNVLFFLGFTSECLSVWHSRFKGEVGKGLKNLSSTNHFLFGVRGLMDAKQISTLSNYSIISLLLLIFRELANRLGVPLVPLTDSTAQGSQDTEAGSRRVENPTPNSCWNGCGIAGCHKWCELEGDHTAHRCFQHSWD